MGAEEYHHTVITNSGEFYLLTGVLLANTIFFAAIYFGLNKKIAYLFFSSYSLFGALSLLLLQENQMLLFLILFTLSCICLLLFFWTFFHVWQSRWTPVIPAVLIMIIIGGVQLSEWSNTIYLMIAWLIFALALMICSWISLQAVKYQKYGGKLLFFTTLFIFLSNIILISDSFLISSMGMASGLFVLAVSYTVLQDIRMQNELISSLRLKAVNLENEMLKKAIQPHFLLNTLTVLSEWIEEKPARAVKQINWLAKEFRFISRVSGKTLILLAEELEMCRIHLNIFNAKQASRFILKTRGTIAETKIPPMIFHTLIENGLTHSNADEGLFLIEQQESNHETSFRVSAGPLGKLTSDGEGLGMSYIKSRLEQAFPGKWTMKSEAKNQAWETLIVIEK